MLLYIHIVIVTVIINICDVDVFILLDKYTIIIYLTVLLYIIITAKREVFFLMKKHFLLNGETQGLTPQGRLRVEFSGAGHVD